jgi:hypothetical protein
MRGCTRQTPTLVCEIRSTQQCLVVRRRGLHARLQRAVRTACTTRRAACGESNVCSRTGRPAQRTREAGAATQCRPGGDRHDHARAYRVQTAAERALRHLPAAHAPISAVSPSPEDPSISLVRTVDAEISRSTLQRVPAHSQRKETAQNGRAVEAQPEPSVALARPGQCRTCRGTHRRRSRLSEQALQQHRTDASVPLSLCRPGTHAPAAGG